MNGCEANLSNPLTCGSCFNTCATGPNAFPTCTNGACGLSCARGFGDCDRDPFTGCEADLLNDPFTCGSCFTQCFAGPNQFATCSVGRCMAQCAPGFADCDMFGGNGCEASLDAPQTCGSCRTSCAMGQACVGQQCAGCPPTRVLSLNSSVMGMLGSGAARLPPPTCSPNANGIEDVWTLTVTTPTSVVIETGGPLDTVLFVRSSCGAATDLVCNDDTPGINFSSRVSVGLQPGTYFVIVKEFNPGAGGSYTLSVTTTPNVACTAPTVIQPGVPITQHSAGGLTPSNRCVGATGGQLFYRLDVPPMQQAAITVTGDGTASLTTRLLTSCTATTCLATNQGTGTQMLSFSNPGASTSSIIISVAATSAGMDSSFTISAMLSPTGLPAYALTPIIAVCDNLSLEPDVLGPATMPRIGDDVTTPPIALPFPFAYFKLPVTHWSVATNGFAQLHASATSQTSNSFQGPAMPNVNIPNAVLAPLWTDLIPAGPQSHIRAMTTGMPPARTFTVEWLEFAFFANGVGPERLQFQLKLIEQGNVIEFHYCSMQLNGGDPNRLTGSTSTVGVENATGTEAVQHSFRTPNTISAGAGLRFTPQ